MYNLKNKIPPKNRDIVKLCYLKLKNSRYLGIRYVEVKIKTTENSGCNLF